MKKIVAACLISIAAIAGCGGSKTVTYEDSHYGARAYRHFAGGDLPRAIEDYKKTYAAARKIDNPAGAARGLSNIGRVYYEMGRHDSAALYFAKAYEDFSVLGNNAEAAKSAAYLALCFAEAGDGSQAKHWFNTASAGIGKKKDAAHYCAVIKGMMDFKLTSKVSDEPALDAAAKYYKKKKAYSALVTINILKAGQKSSENNCAAAEQHLIFALDDTDKSGETYRRSGILLKLARIKFCTGDDSNGSRYYNRARDCAPKGISVPTIDEISACNAGCR